jgi:hypothetical protein
MKILEKLGVDEYYQTISTWMKIIDEKNKAIEGAGKKGGMGDDGDGETKTRKRMSAKSK